MSGSNYGSSNIPLTLFGTGVGTLFANPLEIVTTRYQHADYTRGKLIADIRKLSKDSGINVLRYGLNHALARNITIALAIGMTDPMQRSQYVIALLAAALSHPFETLRVR